MRKILLFVVIVFLVYLSGAFGSAEKQNAEHVTRFRVVALAVVGQEGAELRPQPFDPGWFERLTFAFDRQHVV